MWSMICLYPSKDTCIGTRASTHSWYLYCILNECVSQIAMLSILKAKKLLDTSFIFSARPNGSTILLTWHFVKHCNSVEEAEMLVCRQGLWLLGWSPYSHQYYLWIIGLYFLNWRRIHFSLHVSRKEAKRVMTCLFDVSVLKIIIRTMCFT